MPRKINAANSAPVPPPKASKRKVVQLPLVLPRTLTTERDSANGDLSREDEEERVSEARSRSASSAEDTAPQLDEGALATCAERGAEAHSHSRDKCVSADEDKISQPRRKLSESISDGAVENNASLSHEMESSNVESGSKSMEAIRVQTEETHSITEEEEPPKAGGTRRDEGTSNVVDNAENLESSSPNLIKFESSSDDDDAKCESRSASAVPSVSPRNVPSLEVTSERPEDSLSARDREARRENDVNWSRDMEGEIQRDRASPTGDCLQASAAKPDRAIKPNIVERTRPLRQRPACPERPPRSPRKATFVRDTEENVQAAAKHVHPGNATSDDATVRSSGLGKDRETCAVISTIPKCERLDAVKEHDAFSNLSGASKRDVAPTDRRQRLDERSQVQNATNDDGEEPQKQRDKSEESTDDNARSAKRTKVVRSQSKSDDFQMDILKRQKRYLTSPPEDIVYALNLHLPETRGSMSSRALETEQADVGRCANGTREVNVDKGESCGGLVTGACRCTTTNVLS